MSLVPGGYLAFQIPIGTGEDAPLEDTIAIRSYEFDDLQRRLQQNGLRLLALPSREHASLGPRESAPTFHQFFLAQKICAVRPEIHVGWMEAECGDHPVFP